MANTKIQGYAQRGGNTVTTQGLISTTKVEQSYPSATVTVFDAGTTNLSTIYSDSAGTPKSNPFSAATDGLWFFYAPAGNSYDVRFSGTGITPFTLSDLISPGGGAGSGISGSGTTAKIPKFTGSTNIGNSLLSDDGSIVTNLARTQLGSGTNFLEPGQANQGLTSQALQVAIGSALSPNAINTPVISIQKQDSTDVSNTTSIIPFLFSVEKPSGGGNLYALHSFVRNLSPTLTDAVALQTSIYARPASTPGIIQTNWAAAFRAERAVTGTRISGAEFDAVNSTNTDASTDPTSADFTCGLNIVATGYQGDGTTQPTVSAKNGAGIQFQTGNPNSKGSFQTGIGFDLNSVSGQAIDLSNLANTVYGIKSPNCLFDLGITIDSSLAKKIFLGAISGSPTFPGIWFGSATPSLTNFAFLYEPNLDASIINGTAGVYFRVANQTAAVLDTNLALILSKYIEGVEITDPSAPAANSGRLYFRDNGSGKTQLVARFPTGAVQVIVTEP